MQEEYRSVLKLDTSGFLGPLKQAGSAMKEFTRGVSQSAAKESARAQKEVAQAGAGAAKGAQQSAEQTRSAFGRLKDIPGALFRGVKEFVSGFAGGAVEEYRRIREEAGATGDSAAQSAEKSAERVKGGVLPKLKSAFSSLFRGVKGVLSGVGSFMGNLFKGAVQGIKGALPGARRNIQGLGSDAKSGAMAFLKYALGIRSIYALVNKFRSFTAEGMKNLVQFSAATNGAVSSMMSALTQLKNSLATAFAPIVEVVAPYITSFLKMISGAITAVSAFFPH